MNFLVKNRFMQRFFLNKSILFLLLYATAFASPIPITAEKVYLETKSPLKKMSSGLYFYELDRRIALYSFIVF